MKKRDSITYHEHHNKAESIGLMPQDIKIYRFGFWLFFFLVIFSVLFSVWAMSSIYSNFVVVTKILDESFDRTNLVMDITSSKLIQCQQQVNECKAAGTATTQPPELQK